MKFDFLTDYMIPPGGYHSIELTVNWQFDSWFDDRVAYWNTLDKSVRGILYINNPTKQGFKSLIDYIESLAYKQFDAEIAKRMHFQDIRVRSTSIWIKYSDEGGSYERDLSVFSRACYALKCYSEIPMERNKIETDSVLEINNKSDVWHPTIAVIVPYVFKQTMSYRFYTIEWSLGDDSGVYRTDGSDECGYGHNKLIRAIYDSVDQVGPPCRCWKSMTDKNLHISDIAFDKDSIIFYVDFGENYYATSKSFFTLNKKLKIEYERRKSMPTHKDSVAALCYSDLFYSIKEFNLKIKNVIFNDPATIVFWSDGSKTVVKCGERDTFDPEKGLAMAISKKFLGNKGNYNNEFKKWLPKEYEHSEEIEPDDLAKDCSKFGKAVADGFKKAIDDLMG